MTCLGVYVSVESVSGSSLADYDEFFTNMRPQLVGLAFALTGNLQVASDLAQEALLRSWINWEKIRTYQDPSAWARRVLRNLAANHARHLRHAPRATPIEDVPELDADRVALLGALGHLPRPQREALVLHDGLGLTVAEVAVELNVPEGTVRSWLSRARALLAPILSAGDDTTEVIR
jgi:RNA polymerase sigma-70 factor (ECF subfamily)